MRSAGRSYFNRTPRVLILGPAMVCMGISIFFATAVSNNILFALAGLLYGLGVGYGFPAILSLGGDLAPMYLRPKVMSFILFFMDLSWFLLPLYMGYVSDLSDITVAYRGLALVSVVMGIAVYILWSGTYVRISGNGG
jgi:MFS family permease